MKTVTLWVAAYEDFFRCPPDNSVEADRAVWEKCTKLGWRVIWLAAPQDVVLVYCKPPQALLDHMREIMGYLPLIVWPQMLSDGRLDLVGDVANDPRFIERILAHAAGRPIQVHPLMARRSILRLLKVLRGHPHGPRAVTLVGTSEKLVEQEMVMTWNNKAVFERWVRTNAPDACMPDREIVRGTQALQASAEALIEAQQTAIIQLAISAGGLGNQAKGSLPRLENFMCDVAAAGSEWDVQEVLVAPKLNVVADISATTCIGEDGPGEVLYAVRNVYGLESVGTSLPSSSRYNEMLAPYTKAYFTYLYEQGYRGWVDIDAVIYKDSVGDIALGLCESNARILLTNVAIALREHFARKWQVTTREVTVQYTEKPPQVEGAIIEQIVALGKEVTTQIEGHVGHAVILPPDSSGCCSHLVAGIDLLAASAKVAIEGRLEIGDIPAAQAA